MSFPAAHTEHAQQTVSRRPRVGVLGATLGTGNLGVDALGISMVQGLVAAIPDLEIVYQSWDPCQKVTVPLGERSIDCEPIVIRRKGSLRHRDGLSQIQNLARMRNWLTTLPSARLPTFSHALRQLLSCDAILDVSAGDSFANIYGQDVFQYQAQIKLLCLELGLPLILMPQTYGPFNDRASADLAASILSRATLVCTREAAGVQEVEQLCGDRPPGRILSVPDMAILLEPREAPLPIGFQKAVENGTPRIALNVSGLLFFARRSLGLQLDYQQLVRRLLDWALSLPKSHVLLVPHVVANARVPVVKNRHVANSDSSDTVACQQLASELDASLAARVDVLPAPQDPSQAKYALARCDYFVGARMHAFIGAISQTVPGTLLAYSKKAEGLARLLGIGAGVVDLRACSIEQCLAAVAELYRHREATQAHLAQRVPLAQTELRSFFQDEIAPLVLRRQFNSAEPHYQHENAAALAQEKRVFN